MSLPKAAEVVIIGGGVMGASIAYHLANRGMRDILLLEKDDFFGEGATGRCAGEFRWEDYRGIPDSVVSPPADTPASRHY